jgi:glycosyltransferase involved in cell wall biosynthesis
MRVLFYLLDDLSNASSRYRVVQYLPCLAARGIECTPLPPLPAWMQASRLEPNGPAGKALFYALFFAYRLRTVLGASTFDVVAIQRDLFPFGPPLLERLLRSVNPALLYDTDDATHIPPPFAPRNAFQRLRRFDKVSEVIRISRQVTVASPELADYARQFNPRVSLVPMAIDWARYEPVAVQRSSWRVSDQVVIGWTGTPGGFLYLEDLAPVLRRVAQRVRVRYQFVSGGWARMRLIGLAHEAVPWTCANELTTLATFDIGIVPLADTAFERAKFPFKLLQYMALGIPPICARIGFAREVIVDGENGFLVGSSEEWEERLVQLACDAPLRKRVGAAARETVRHRFTLEHTAPLLCDALVKAAEEDRRRDRVL